MKIGYARVSTVDQNEARQMEALREEGVDRIYMDKKSGKDFNRPEYQKMIASLQKGDVLVVHSIDRLGRNYEEIITEWRKITKEIEADIIVQDMPLLNTSQNKDLTGTLKILDEIKSTWGERGKNAENKLISDLTYADILIIDDFGAESGKDWINEKFYGIINGRYVDKKTTIFTSNYPISRLKYDDRITNRILERSLEIPFPEESVREHIADAMKQELIKKIQGGENGKQA